MRSKKRKLGLAFSDELIKVDGSTHHLKKSGTSGEGWEEMLLPQAAAEVVESEISSWRLLVLAVLVLAAFFGLFLRLFQLQVVLGNYHQQLADSNRVQMKIIHASRGVIYDRNGKILAENIPGFRMGKNLFISRDEALKWEAQDNPRFAELEIDNIRYYPYGEVAAPVLGYTGEISEEEMKGSSSYRLGDRLGRAGIEKSYEAQLKGVDGAEIVEVDAQGKKLRLLRRIEPTPGKNIHLSLDIDLQKVAFQSLKKGVSEAKSCCGAVVALDPQSGEVLTLVSLPSYDANTLTDPRRIEEAAGYFNNENAPFLNRAISGTYPPGSTFKITSALAGLSLGKINSRTKIEDSGVVSIGPYKYANWYFTQYGKTEGLVDIVKALQRSNDIFFYRVGEYVGEKELGRVAKSLGFGRKLRIDLPEEAEGLIPTNEWKQENIGEVWYPGDTLHLAIGQGFLLTTPLQVLTQTAFIADKGSLIQPHLLSKITSPEGFTIKEFSFEPIVKDIFKKEDLEIVGEGLKLVPKLGGTAWPFFNFSIPTAGKTGTAEFGDPEGKTHAWYTSYAPAENPRIALTVLVEAGGEGSSIAAPIAKEIYTWYFNDDKTNIKSLDKNPLSTNSGTESGKTLGE
ncbi:MAG: Peptidoglycan glycosyltransferase [Candidatus Daviesbacteria bacterium GW2011_GWA1_41_61]|uniref:Peptidoglycan glycosyltransferase n=1 Tax=Candidatus Daviesbacteria bacterium GW2011_GWA2_40_9 TaxID=1618424 RepID=A0A0G0U7S3_9BACT|nr:MAG: penicillin-binding protein 2, penicillin-binding protein 2 [Candidatus Daviesbacteria bacterium GW2011_GWC1_40_9]KKR83271.1 MAG: Peptidoglycan glycosyltransferase [Candidatus Daviesbacteria bacterium GW2011_GWA2_40_9]KKR93616.1 MAG: Peptidoglycan glycosyltransferase [Candidatus Daviesbacteria bacterium GW2011_GWB1_41_15]KKS14833.1 MAG: Peptidoglycan glycosyltransferase [Candidatus Daviesbacteria bacterium GW2011_GWA1_41_61]